MYLIWDALSRYIGPSLHPTKTTISVKASICLAGFWACKQSAHQISAVVMAGRISMANLFDGID